MAKKPTRPIKVTAILADGRINSADGIIMLDSILYHAWFIRNAPEVLEGLGSAEPPKACYFGLPLRQMDGNRYCASKAVYEQEGVKVEHWNKRPNFFNAEYERHLDMQSGMIPSTMGAYRAYRIPQVIRIVKDGKLTFYAMGHADEVQALLDEMHAVGKKASMGWGIVDRWIVEECEEDYSLFHPKYGLMRPTPVEELPELTGYPILKYGVRPPYWKEKNRQLCHVPIVEVSANDV